MYASVFVHVYVCKCVCARECVCMCVCMCVFVVIRQQIIRFNLVSFVNIVAISVSPLLTPHPLRPPPLFNVHMRLALCLRASLSLSLLSLFSHSSP